METGLPERAGGTGHLFLDLRADGGPLERLFAQLAVTIGTADCWFDVAPGSGRPARIGCASKETRRFVARWLHAMREAEQWEVGRNRPILPAPKPGKPAKHHRPRSGA